MKKLVMVKGGGDLATSTPEEIALSIAAQVVGVFRGGSLRPLALDQ